MKKGSFDCDCGKKHISETVVTVMDGALLTVPEMLRKKSCKKAFVVTDKNTYNAAGKALVAVLKENGVLYTLCKYIQDQLFADEKTMGTLLIRYENDCDVIVGVGSGTINDICRFLAYQLQKPYLIVATAPSMDGYCSTVSPLIVNGLKTTFNAVAPCAVICDLSVLSAAPPLMRCAGLGDILGKLTCLCDWKLGALLTGEYYCDYIVQMMRESIDKCFLAYGDGSGLDQKSPRPLIEALCLSGTAMAYAGNSRPASGAEHHIAHFWEMHLLAENRPPVLHGLKVAFTTLIVMEIYRRLLDETVSWGDCEQAADAFSFKDYSLRVFKAYKNGAAAKDIVESEFFMYTNTAAFIRKRLAQYKQKWPEVKKMIEQHLPDPVFCARFLRNAGLPESPFAFGIDKKTFIDSILYAKELRNRFTVLQIAADLGVLEKYARQIAATYY